RGPLRDVPAAGRQTPPHGRFRPLPPSLLPATRPASRPARRGLTGRRRARTVPAMDAHWASLAVTDPDIARLIHAEERLQRDKIRLIPSENYVSGAVLAATGSVLTNKYSEGYPGRRYYEGQQFID